MEEMTLKDVKREVGRAVDEIGKVLSDLRSSTGLRASHISMKKLEVISADSVDREFVLQPYIHFDGDHIHYVGDGRGARRTLLNGVKLADAIFVDTRQGYAEIHIRDDAGVLKLGGPGHKGVQSEIVRGKLEVQYL